MTTATASRAEAELLARIEATCDLIDAAGGDQLAAALDRLGESSASLKRRLTLAERLYRTHLEAATAALEGFADRLAAELAAPPPPERPQEALSRRLEELAARDRRVIDAGHSMSEVRGAEPVVRLADGGAAVAAPLGALHEKLAEEPEPLRVVEDAKRIADAATAAANGRAKAKARPKGRKR